MSQSEITGYAQGLAEKTTVKQHDGRGQAQITDDDADHCNDPKLRVLTKSPHRPLKDVGQYRCAVHRLISRFSGSKTKRASHLSASPAFLDSCGASKQKLIWQRKSLGT